MLRCVPLRLQVPNFNGAFGGTLAQHPIVQLPARSLWCEQQHVPLQDLAAPEFRAMAEKLRAARSYYQYPALAAPQIGWNVKAFVLFDGTLWVNPTTERLFTDTTAWTWEPSASCPFLMHYIERPLVVDAAWYDAEGRARREELTGMRSRLFQHCQDFLQGVLFTRRIPDSDHVVPMDGFHSMSDWANDFPSLEARSTNLYTLFQPPGDFHPEFLPDSDLLDRKYDKNVYPGHETMAVMKDEERRHKAALDEFVKNQRKAAQ